jgi:hypothetical protein
MKYKTGSIVVLKNEFFEITKQFNILEKRKRPLYFSFKDKNDLIWMVPCTSKIDKWKKRMQIKTVQKNVKIINILGRKQVLLFRNMFPTIEKFIDHIFTIDNKQAIIRDRNTIMQLNKIAKNTMYILRSGKQLSKYPPDISRIEQIMLRELENDNNNQEPT